jgi:peptide/nickel transport system permease protein
MQSGELAQIDGGLMKPDFREVKHRSQARQAFGKLLRNRGAMIGLAVLVALVFMAVCAPVLAPYNPLKIDPLNNFQAPSLAHPMGTDDIGRDVLSRVIYGSRLSLAMGLVSVLIAASIGTLLGLQAGYAGGWLDAIIMRLMDIMMALPGILMALVIVTILGPGLVNVMIAVGISWIPSYARLARGSVLAVKQQDYVTAARCVGSSGTRIALRHVLPNIMMPIIIWATLGVAAAILSGASLNFLGLGAQPPTPEWGSMLNSARQYVRMAWWWITFPGLAIMVTVLATSLFGDGLRDALDPHLKF